jgi:hypothetical protein
VRKLVSRRKILGFAGIALNFCAANQATNASHAKNLLVCLVSKVVTWGSDCEDCEMIGTYCKCSCADDDDDDDDDTLLRFCRESQKLCEKCRTYNSNPRCDVVSVADRCATVVLQLQDGSPQASFFVVSCDYDCVDCDFCEYGY